jgi:glycosyltransferase involved in cell wall biosynthesis
MYRVKKINTSTPIRILCIDPDSGLGGSSLSLYLSLLNMNRDGLLIEIWFACDSPLSRLYDQLGIKYKVVPSIVKLRSLRRLSRNVYTFLQYLPIFFNNISAYREIAFIIKERFDLVHFNQEGTFLIAYWLRKHVKDVPFIFHVRTLLPKNWFTKLQVKIISLSTNYVIFISRDEQDRFYWAGFSLDNCVLYNIASLPKLDNTEIYSELKNDKRLKILSLSNFRWEKGIDRFIDIAQELVKQERESDFLFIICGDMRITGELHNDFSEFANHGGEFEEYVNKLGLQNMFLFLGHIKETYAIISEIDLLLKPTREEFLGGRDIIEVMSVGKPVMAVGNGDQFVVTRKTGILYNKYNTNAIIKDLVMLLNNPDIIHRMGDLAKSKVNKMCNKKIQANKLLNLWKDCIKK